MQTAMALNFASVKFSRLFHIALLILQFGFLATPTESSADEKSRRACIKSSGGVVDEGVCNQIEIDKLIDKNNQLVVKIESELTSCTPTSEACDYTKAQSNLKKSNQKLENLCCARL